MDNKKLIVFYDNWCPNCSRFIKIIKRLDWLELIHVKKLRNEPVDSYFPDIDISLAKKQMASNINGDWKYGYVSIYRIISRIPLFIIFFPMLFFLKITGLGKYLYNQLALKRNIIPIHCNEDSCEI